jgi:hypothetical protein
MLAAGKRPPCCTDISMGLSEYPPETGVDLPQSKNPRKDKVDTAISFITYPQKSQAVISIISHHTG